MASLSEVRKFDWMLEEYAIMNDMYMCRYISKHLYKLYKSLNKEDKAQYELEVRAREVERAMLENAY